MKHNAEIVLRALIAGHTIETAMKWGTSNSISVIKYIGAQEGLLTKSKIAHGFR